jgi:hypothetical protein
MKEVPYVTVLLMFVKRMLILKVLCQSRILSNVGKTLNCIICKQQGIENGSGKFVERHEERSKKK